MLFCVEIVPQEDEFMKNKKQAMLICDGSCSLCSGVIAWIKKNEKENSFVMLPCQMEETFSQFPGIERMGCLNAIHLVLPNGTILVGEQAIPEVLERLRRYRFLALFFTLPGSQTMLRIAYRWFADQRYKLVTILSYFTGKRNKQPHW